MPSSSPHERSRAQCGAPAPPPGGAAPDDARGGVDGLIAQAGRLREAADAVCGAEPARGAGQRVRRALWEVALARLEEFSARLEQLRGGPGPEGLARLGGRVGTAEWNLLTDTATWSRETFAIFGRTPEQGPLTLDQLPSRLPVADRPVLTAAVTACLVDGRPMDCEVRVARPDGSLRTVQLAGEPVLDERGGTVAMWAMVRDVSELRRGAAEAVVPRDGDPAGETARQRQRRLAGAGHDAALRLAGNALAPWPGGPEREGLPAAPGALELAVRYLPAATSPLAGKWYDTMSLPGGGHLLSVGDLSGAGPAPAASAVAAVGAIRGAALAGAPPGALLGHLGQLLDRGPHPVLGSAVCCRFEPAATGGGRLTWAQAGHPAPLLCRGDGGRTLPRPAGTLLGAVAGARFAQRTDRLRPGDVLVLHTDGLFSANWPRRSSGRRGRDAGPLAALAPALAAAGTAAECLELIVDACGESDREEDACLLVARPAG